MMSETIKKLDLGYKSVLNTKIVQPTLLYLRAVNSEEKFNSYSHLVGTVLSVIGSLYLILNALSSGILMIFSFTYGFFSA